jgi:hypothetical protein
VSTPEIIRVRLPDIEANYCHFNVGKTNFAESIRMLNGHTFPSARVKHGETVGLFISARYSPTNSFTTA